MTGTFSGTFDGYGNTLTVDYTATSQRCGAFGYLGSASIQNLKVAGTISTAYQAAGGLATWCNEGASAYITNCRVSTIISSSVSGDGTHGGFVAYTDGKLYFTGCVFDGSLTGSTTNACSGFVYNSGWNGAAVSLTDCLLAPSSVTIGTGASATFVRGTAPTITNCYYTQTLGTAQGTQAHTIAAGDYVSSLSVTKGDATATYDVSGITVYSGGIDFNDGSTTTFYGGSGQEVSLALTAATRDGYQFKQYAASQGTLSDETTNTPTLTMPAANSTANDVVTISAEYDPLYNATFAQNIDDAEHWTISPTKTTAGSTVSLAYTGTTHRVNSVTVMKEGEATETFETTKEVNNYAGTNVSIYAEHEGDNYGFNVHSDFATTISTTNGKNITSVVLTTGSGSVTPSNVTASPGTCTVSGNIVTITDINATSVSISSNKWGYIKVSQVDVTYPGLVPDNDVTIDWNGAENTGTFTMPAYDVVVSADMEIPTYNVTFADGNDNDDWMIDPEQQIVGGTVTVSYEGENKVKSVTVTKLALCSLSEVTSEHVGKIIGADGNVYASLAQAEKVTSAVGVLGKVTETGHGLIMSLEDAPQQVWATIDGWASASYAGTTLKVLPNDDARGSNLPSYTTLGSTTVSNWAVATRADYTAIFTNLGSTGGDNDGISYDANMNAKITGAGGTAISGQNWSSTQYDSSKAWRFASTWGGRDKTDQYKVRPVLGF